MEVNITVKKVTEFSNEKFSITAEDPTHGIMRIGFQKKYGTPQVGDVITLHYLRNSCRRIVGMDLNGQQLYRN